MAALWNINAPNAVQLFDFRDAITKVKLSNATITAKLINHTKTADIAGSAFSIPLVDAPTAHYGGISNVQSFDENTLMWLEIKGMIGEATVYLQQFEVVAGYGPSG